MLRNNIFRKFAGKPGKFKIIAKNPKNHQIRK